MTKDNDESIYEITKHGTKLWKNKYRMFHRTDGPAIEHSNGDKFWCVNGNYHRTDGPAIEFVGESKSWYVDGTLHRLDGPAIEYADGSKDWWVDGKRHRTDGPAVERINGSKEWYIDGIELTEEEFKYWSKDLVMFKLTYS